MHMCNWAKYCKVAYMHQHMHTNVGFIINWTTAWYSICHNYSGFYEDITISPDPIKLKESMVKLYSVVRTNMLSKTHLCISEIKTDTHNHLLMAIINT